MTILKTNYLESLEMKRQIIFIAVLTFIFLKIGCSVKKQFYGLPVNKYEYIKNETIDGKLDATKTLDKKKFYIINGKGYAYDYMALCMWGKAVKEIGIIKSSDAIALYEEIVGRKINSRQKKAIKVGFNSK